MEQKEILYYQDDSYLVFSGTEKYHKKNCYEIDLMIKGSGFYFRNDKKYGMEAGDIVIFNPLELHSVGSDSNSLVGRILISDQSIYKYCRTEKTEFPFFACEPEQVNENNQQYYTALRLALANLLIAYLEKNDHWKLKVEQYRHELLFLLFSYFKEQSGKRKHPMDQKILAVLQYIHEHLHEELSVEAIAEHFYFSVSYLTRIFNAALSMSPGKYIARERALTAADKLANTSESITDIAENCGFNNLRSFENAFLKYMGKTPSEYRKSALKHNYTVEFNPEEASAVIQHIKNLVKTCQTAKTLQLEQRNIVIIPTYKINLAEEKQTMSDSWKRLVNVANASDLLDADVQSRILKVKREIGFQYIHFHGLLSDEMRVYNEDAGKNSILEFGLINKVLDFLVEAGIKPYLEFGFMPRGLTENKNLKYGGYHTKPYSQARWNMLLAAFMQNCYKRYGTDEVESWLFQIWDSAYISGWWENSIEDFLKFYRASYVTLKKESEHIRIGMPSINVVSLKKTKWLERFMDFCCRNSCVPDFISLAVYPHDDMRAVVRDDRLILNDITANIEGLSNPICPSEDVNYFSNAIQLLKKKLSVFDKEDIPIYVTQWNINNVPYCLSRDTVQNAGYVLKNILDNMNQVNSFGYWFLTDEKEEYYANSFPFCGGMGIVTHDGIELPSYHAIQMMAWMRGNEVFRDDGLLITRQKNNTYILMFNFIYYKKEICKGLIPMNVAENRYSEFDTEISKSLSLKIEGITPGKYKMTELILNRKHGSAYDVWREMGEPELLSKYDIRYINSVSRPARKTQFCILSKAVEINRILEPFEVRMIAIER